MESPFACAACSESITVSCSAAANKSIMVSAAMPFHVQLLQCLGQMIYFSSSGNLAADGYLHEWLNISKLMSEYTEKDKHYDGVVGPVCVVDNATPQGPPRPILRW